MLAAIELLFNRHVAAGIREVSKGGPGRPAFGTRSCAQGLVCYTFCSARRAKGWCRLSGQHTFTRRKRRPKTAKERAAFGCCFRKGSKGEMQCCLRFRRNKRYIKNSNKLSSFIFDAVFLAPYMATEKHGNISCGKISRMKYFPVLPQRKCFQIASILIGRERKVIAN